MINMEKILEDAGMTNEKGQKAATSDPKNNKLTLDEYLSKYGVDVKGKERQAGRTLHILEHCLFDESHTGKDAVIIQYDDGRLGYHCFHDSCADKHWKDARRVISGDDPLMGRIESTETGDSTREQRKKIRVIDVFDFMSLELPPRETLLEPWLPKQGLVMIHSQRGTGKTHVATGIAYAVAAGSPFLVWRAPEPRGVLYIDGEMPAAALQERIARISVSNELEPRAPLRIITPDLQPGGMIDLSRAEDQRELQPYLEGIDLVIVDNISCLCRTGKENEGEAWLPVQEWALQQRAAGRSVLFIHHTGKNGQQRGTSRREDVLDTVISLRRPGDYTPDQGALFEVHFEKARGIYGADTKPFEAQLTTTPDERQCWVTKQLEESTVEKVANLLNEGVPQREIAEMLGIAKGSVSKAKKRAEKQGLLVSESSFHEVSQFPSLGGKPGNFS